MILRHALDSGHLPEQWVTIATAPGDLLECLRTSDSRSLDWTCFSPAGFIQRGPGTGKFRLGNNELIIDAEGQSRISEDYAMACSMKWNMHASLGGASRSATERSR